MQAVHLETLQDACMGKNGDTAWTVLQSQALEDAQRLLARCCCIQPCSSDPYLRSHRSSSCVHLTSPPCCLTHPGASAVVSADVDILRQQQLLGALQCAGTGGASLL